MKVHPFRRVFTRVGILSALVLPMAALTTGLVSGPAAQAQVQTATSGSLSFTVDPSETTYSYSTANNDVFTASNNAIYYNSDTSDHIVTVQVDPTQGGSLYLTLQAPSSGPALAPGTYSGATPNPNSAQPGLSFWGNGFGCYSVSGSFTITNITWGPYGYVQGLDATFNESCLYSATTALRGEIHITTPPAPPVLTLAPTLATDGTVSTVSGNATVHGTVTCNKAVDVNMAVEVTQVANNKKDIIRGGWYWTVVHCTPGAPVPWSADATPNGTLPFHSGDIQATTHFGTADPDYPNYINLTRTAVVALEKAKA